MTHYIKEVEYTKFLPPSVANESFKNLLFPEQLDIHLILTGSGKAALYIILAYFHSIGKIKNKNDTVWTPKWIGGWVYNTMQKLCFPVLERNNQTTGMLIYHQYGYPQNMEKLLHIARSENLFVIEDCAHAIHSYYKKQLLGTLGNAAIFSFSKIFPSLMGGAIVTKDEQLAAFAKNFIKKSKTWLGLYCYFSKWLTEKFSSGFLNKSGNRLVEMSYAVHEQAAHMPKFARQKVIFSIKNQDIKKRLTNKEYFLQNFNNTNFFNKISQKNIIPYVLPLFAEEVLLHKLKKQLIARGILTDIYHFDTNQDMSEPNFEKCLWIPIHPGIKEKERRLITSIIRQTLDEK